MTGGDKEDSGRPNQEKRKLPRWKRLLKFVLCLILAVVMAFAAFAGVLVFKHYRIVGAKPGQLQTKVQPTELGRRVIRLSAPEAFRGSAAITFPAR
jgi:hypothetical protein